MPELQLDERRRARRPEREQSGGVAVEKANRGGEHDRDDRERPSSRLEWNAHRRPEYGRDDPGSEDDRRRRRLVRDVVGDRFVNRCDRARESIVHLALAYPAIDVPGVPRQRRLIHERDAEEIARERLARVSLHCAGRRDRPPDPERDDGLGDSPDDPDRNRRAILQIDEEGRAHQLRVLIAKERDRPARGCAACGRGHGGARRTSARASGLSSSLGRPVALAERDANDFLDGRILNRQVGHVEVAQ